MSKADRGRRIAILGGNFAGLSAALALPAKYDVTLIDAASQFEWTPNIHELVSGVKAPEHLGIDRKKLLRRHDHSFLQARAQALDPDNNRIRVSSAVYVDYDACIVATGGDTLRDRVKGAAEHSIPFRTVADCHAIYGKLQKLAERRKFSVTIVGGGVSGVEALGELLRSFRHHEGMTVHVVEAGPHLMPGSPPELDEDIRAHCEGLDVQFHCDVKVEKISAHSVWLSNACLLPTDLAIWTAGQTIPAILEEAGLGPGAADGAPVKPTLQSERKENVFVAGDCAVLKKPIKRQAYHAIEMGEHAAMNCERFLCGRKLKKYRPSRKPILVAFGDLDTYLVAGKRVIAGRSLAGAKEALFQGGMALFAPPLGKEEAAQFYKRFSRSMTHLLLPQFDSLEMAMALGRYRWVA